MKPKIILMLLLLSPISCLQYVHEDFITSFIIDGQVYDKSTKLPLEQVKIAFIDTGFDYKRSKHQVPITIGASETKGNIDLKFDYWWGTTKSIFSKDPKKTFDIMLSKKSYKYKIIHFKASELIKKESKLIINLNEIYLDPARKGEELGDVVENLHFSERENRSQVLTWDKQQV